MSANVFIRGISMPVRGRWLALSLAFAISLTTAAAWAAFSPIPSDSNELVFVIPKGTWARRNAGEKIAILPAEIRMTLNVKDVLVLRNQDDVPQMFGPVLIMPGQDFELPFRMPSLYLFACTLHSSGQLSVVVVPEPKSGYERLSWRVRGFFYPGASV